MFRPQQPHLRHLAQSNAIFISRGLMPREHSPARVSQTVPTPLVPLCGLAGAQRRTSSCSRPPFPQFVLAPVKFLVSAQRQRVLGAVWRGVGIACESATFYEVIQSLVFVCVFLFCFVFVNVFVDAGRGRSFTRDRGLLSLQATLRGMRAQCSQVACVCVNVPSPGVPSRHQSWILN